MHAFDAPGTYRYVCTVHRAMTGRVEVAALALEGPREPVAPGDRVVLSGRAPAGTGTISLERGARWWTARNPTPPAPSASR